MSRRLTLGNGKEGARGGTLFPRGSDPRGSDA